MKDKRTTSQIFQDNARPFLLDAAVFGDFEQKSEAFVSKWFFNVRNNRDVIWVVDS